MKKIIPLLIALFLMLSLSTVAGSVPESLLIEDTSLVFIGTIENFTLKSVDGYSSRAEVETVEVIPTEKIKGDVKTGVKQVFTRCDSVLTLQKGEEYLFGYIDENNFYIYEIKSRYENTIELVDSDKYDMTKRLENYLNEGAFMMAEHERTTIGKEISLLEYLHKEPSLSSSAVEKVTLRYQDELHEVKKDEFYKTAENIMIIGAKNEMLYETRMDSKSPLPYETVLYIELLDAYDNPVYFGAVSRYGEVDRYSLFMSRLMQKDYLMKPEDLSKLYSLLPEDVQKNLSPADYSIEIVDDLVLPLPPITVKNYTPLIIAGAVSVLVIAFIIGVIYIKKKNK